MSNYKLLTCLSLLVLLLGGCREKTLDVVLPYDGDRLVLYAELTPDQVITLNVSHSYPATGNYIFDAGMPQADVKLFENGTFKGQLIYADSGRFRLPYKPVAGNHYAFVVVCDGYPTVNTLPITMPALPGSPSAQITGRISSPLNPDTGFRIATSWQNTNPATSNNKFMVQLTGQFEGKRLAVNTFQVGKTTEIETSCGYKRLFGRYVYGSECFTGQALQAEFGAESFGFLQEGEGGKRNADAYKVSIVSLSTDYENYLRHESQPEELESAFEPPTARYSNVVNGYGVIIASNSTSFFLKVPK